MTTESPTPPTITIGAVKQWLRKGDRFTYEDRDHGTVECTVFEVSNVVVYGESKFHTRSIFDDAVRIQLVSPRLELIRIGDPIADGEMVSRILHPAAAFYRYRHGAPTAQMDFWRLVPCPPTPPTKEAYAWMHGRHGFRVDVFAPAGDDVMTIRIDVNCLVAPRPADLLDLVRDTVTRAFEAAPDELRGHP